MIDEHHKLRRYADDRYPLVEVFRRGDLADFSLGLLKSGLPGGFVKDVKAAFPNAGLPQIHHRAAGGLAASAPVATNSDSEVVRLEKVSRIGVESRATDPLRAT